MSRTLLALSALAGAALWLTPAVLDLVIGRSDRAVRIATLPAVWQLPIFMLAAWVGVIALARLLPRPDPATASPNPDGAAAHRGDRIEAPSAGARFVVDVLLPIAALGLLLLPYLPWLPDAVPVLRLLAGPGRVLLWFVVGVLVARGFWRRIPPRVRLVHASPRTIVIALFVAGTLISGATGSLFARTILYPGGDEPHYLVIAQSLWRDGDLRIENNHKRGDYREYFDRELAPHYLARGVDRKIYSVHPIGVSVLLAPVYALGGYALVIWVMALMAAAAGAAAWLLAWRLTGSRTAATMAWVACCLNGPWIFNSFAVYPEVPAALMVMVAWLMLSEPRARLSWPRWLLCGAAIATLPWLSTKYVLMALALGLVALGRIWWPADDVSSPNVSGPDVGGSDVAGRAIDADAPVGTETSVRAEDGPHGLEAGRTRPAAPAAANRSGLRAARVAASLAVIVPCAISLAGWFAFFYVIWGTFSPAAPYGAQRETRLAYLPAGAPGLLFDQEYGIIAFAPALFLGLTGLAAMIAARGAARRLAVELLAVGGALLVTVGAFHIWWGGSATVGRPVISGLLLLAVPFAWRYEQQRDKPALRAAYHVLMIGGVAIALTLGLAQEGLLLAAHRSGVSRLLDWLSPTWIAWTIAPTFIRQTPLAAAALTLVWIAAALGAGWWLARQRRTLAPGRAALIALFTCTAAVVVVSLVAALTGRAGGQDAADRLRDRVRTRGRSELLDRFDAGRRPLAIVYDPFQVVDPAQAPSLVEFVARRDDARPRPPIPLTYNGRWSLPAGRYVVELIVGDRKGQPAATGQSPPDAPAPGLPAPAVPAPGGAQAASSATGTLSLQLGYGDRPSRAWDVSMGVPGVWGRTFDLLTDNNLVGFRVSPEIERLAPAIRLRPERIVDKHARLQPANVSSTAVLGDTTVYFHDARMRAEGDGFWTPGTSRVTVTLAAPDMRAARIGLRAGPVPTPIGLAVAGWRERVMLPPGGERSIELPKTASGVVRLIIETNAAFVPADRDPASRDHRSLGAWVMIAP